MASGQVDGIALGAALEGLGRRERIVIWFRFVFGLTFVEVAEILGVSRARVWQLHERGLRELRAALGEP